MTALPKQENKDKQKSNIKMINSKQYSCAICGKFLIKRDGQIQEVDGQWILRFRYHWESWDQNPKVWIQRGKLESSGLPLLKNRKRMRRGLVIRLWKDSLSTGWRRVDPEWC